MYTSPLHLLALLANTLCPPEDTKFSPVAQCKQVKHNYDAT